jgi:hypothetical protein
MKEGAMKTMKRLVIGLSLVAAALLLLAAVPSQSQARGWHGHRGHFHHRHAPRVVVGIGSGFWWGPPALWYTPPPVYVRPRVIVEEPPVYVERPPVSSSSYWYYCESAGAYYPSVPRCPEPWIKVPPRAD